MFYRLCGLVKNTPSSLWLVESHSSVGSQIGAHSPQNGSFPATVICWSRVLQTLMNMSLNLTPYIGNLVCTTTNHRNYFMKKFKTDVDTVKIFFLSIMANKPVRNMIAIAQYTLFFVLYVHNFEICLLKKSCAERDISVKLECIYRALLFHCSVMLLQ